MQALQAIRSVLQLHICSRGTGQLQSAETASVFAPVKLDIQQATSLGPQLAGPTLPDHKGPCRYCAMADQIVKAIFFF